jgi:predicted short-subunit dehydrogenase-like oxidoreductase (DUF2520 family)
LSTIPDRLFVLGAGRAGLGVARALRAYGGTVVGVHGRMPRHDSELPVTAGPVPNSVSRATVVLVAVRDQQLDAALDELLTSDIAPGAIVLHASGIAEPVALERVRAAGHPAGTFHPLVPLALPERAPALMRGAWIGVDGDDEAVAASERLAKIVGAHTVHIPAGSKARYHAAAVFASNFPAALTAIAERLLGDAGIAPVEAHAAVRHLLRSAAANLLERDAAGALTGPVARGDDETVGKHLRAISGDSEALAAYVALSRATVRVAGASGTDREALQRILDLIDETAAESAAK